MQLKDKIKKISIFFNIITMPLCVSLSFTLLLICFLRMDSIFFNTSLLFDAGVLFGFVSFFLYFKTLDEDKTIKKTIRASSQGIFLISVLSLIFFELIHLSNTNIITTFLCVTLVTGIVIFLKEQPKTTKQNLYKVSENYRYKKIIHISLLFFIILNFFVIAIDNLGMLPPQNDEFLTYGAVKYITREGLQGRDFFYGAEDNSSPEFYSRSLPYSLAVAGTIQMIGGDTQSIFDLRFLSVILGCFTLLILYLLYKDKISEIVLFPRLYFFSTFYLFIYHSRVARMYSLVLLLTILLVYLYLSLFKKYLVFENLQNKINLPTFLFTFLQKYFAHIGIFCILLFIGMKTHYNIGLIAFPILLYSIINAKNKYIKIILSILLGAILTTILLIYLGIGPVNQGYLNHTGRINFNFIDSLFTYYRGGAVTLLFFLFPLFHYKRLPETIKFSYLFFISLFIFFLFLTNGIQFHDPRYFIFLFPFYTILTLYGIYVTILNLFPRLSTTITIFILLFLSIFIINKIQIGEICQENIFLACPISDQSKLFNLDRWNYQYDDAYQTIKSSLQENTLVVGRTLHNFFADKYKIPKTNECKILKDFTQNRECTWEDIRQNDIIFIVYPNLIYTQKEQLGYEEIYNYLYKNQNKILIYKSPDSRILIYKINRPHIFP